MLEYVDAPVPFIIGVPRNVWRLLKTRRDPLPSDIVVLDLDKDKLVGADSSPELPPKLTAGPTAALRMLLSQNDRLKQSAGVKASQDTEVSAALTQTVGRVLDLRYLPSEAAVRAYGVYIAGQVLDLLQRDNGNWGK